MTSPSETEKEPSRWSVESIIELLVKDHALKKGQPALCGESNVLNVRRGRTHQLKLASHGFSKEFRVKGLHFDVLPEGRLRFSHSGHCMAGFYAGSRNFKDFVELIIKGCRCQIAQ